MECRKGGVGEILIRNGLREEAERPALLSPAVADWPEAGRSGLDR